MPVQIGGKPESTFDDPIGLLGDCHRRVERFLGVLVKVAGDARGQALTVEQREALESALRYFRDAAPKHTADEEQSLFPRMRAAGGPAMEAVLAQVDALEADHARAGKAHDEVDSLGRRWIESGQLPEDDAARLCDVVSELAALYRNHIAIEDREVFPAAAAALTAEQRKAIGEEMAARRSLKT
ncbi:MAG: hemerythrin domain-containing protein [Bryobacteraceae bacterium]|nr:hemerythrin domain-containing protein [Bryobacteraceae bacterium]